MNCFGWSFRTTTFVVFFMHLAMQVEVAIVS